MSSPTEIALFGLVVACVAAFLQWGPFAAAAVFGFILVQMALTWALARALRPPEPPKPEPKSY